MESSDEKKSQKALLVTKAFFDNYFKKPLFFNSFDYSESYAVSFFDILSDYNASDKQKLTKSLIKNIQLLLKLKPNFLIHKNFGAVQGDKNNYLYEIHRVKDPDPYRVVFTISEDRKKIIFLYIFLENKMTWTRVLNNRLPSKAFHEQELGCRFQVRR